MSNLEEIKQLYVSQWGALGSQWGINRTEAQVHATLMVAAKPMTTDDLMESLKISRGNAHTSLKELVNWGIVRKVVVPGERKDFYEAEKEPWKLFTTVCRERKRREIDPALDILKSCLAQSKELEGEEALALKEQLTELVEFTELASRVLERCGRSERTMLMQLLMKLA